MKKYLEYKGFRGTVSYTQEDGCLFGRIQGLPDATISYEGNSVQELKEDFCNAVEDYLYLRAKNGESLEPPAYQDKICCNAAK